MASQIKTDEELKEAGYLALHEAIGPADAVRFIRLIKPGAGDYTEERTLYNGNPSVEELIERAKQARERREQQSTERAA